MRMPVGMRGWRWLSAAAAVVVLAAGASAQDMSPAEQQLLESTNQVRAEHGLSALAWDSSLADAARAHAELMAQQKNLSHQYPDEPELTLRAAQAGAHFQAIAENIAMGPSAHAIQGQWMNSVPHRTNILDPKMTVIGIAAVTKGGYVYAVADFASAVDSLTPEQVEQKIGRLLQDRGIAPSGPRLDARQTCEMPSGIAGGSHPAAMVRWQGPDTDRLPDALVQRLQSGHFRTAAVGACSSANAGDGFTTYRIAVLLYSDEQPAQ